LNVCGVNDKQTEIHTAWPLVHEPSSFKVEIAIKKQVLFKLLQNRTKQEVVIHFVLRYTNLIVFGIRKNWHSGGRNLLLCLFIKSVIKLTVMTIVGYHCYQLHTTF
jgi:hypothetical protein